MDRRKLFWRLGLAAAFSVLLLGAGEDEFSIRQAADGDATIVTVTGPDALLERVAIYSEYLGRRQDCDAPFSIGGPGFGIDWGDDAGHGTQKAAAVLGVNGCPDPLQHRYTVPGTYRIRALLYHPGPGDGPIGEWADETEVTIGGKTAALDLALLAPAGGATYLFQEDIPVAWTLATGAPVDLVLDLVGEDGAVLESKRFAGLAYVGRGEARLSLRSPAYEQAIADGTATVRLRATLVAAGREPMVRESAAFTLSAEYDSRGGYPPEAALLPNRPLSVKLKHHTFNPDCYGYIVDWGDGSAPERVAAATKQGCPLESTWIETTHAYPAAGSYRIVLRTNDYRLHQQPEQSPYYEVVTVTVP